MCEVWKHPVTMPCTILRKEKKKKSHVSQADYRNWSHSFCGDLAHASGNCRPAEAKPRGRQACGSCCLAQSEKHSNETSWRCRVFLTESSSGCDHHDNTGASIMIKGTGVRAAGEFSPSLSVCFSRDELRSVCCSSLRVASHKCERQCLWHWAMFAYCLQVLCVCIFGGILCVCVYVVVGGWMCV